jgi:hypothetical protein
MTLLAFGLVAAGGALTWAHTTQRDAEGYINSPTCLLESDGYALASGAVDIASSAADWFPEDLLDVRFTAGRADSEGVFVGIGPSAEVAAYLEGVAYDEVTHLGRRADIDYRAHEGGAPSGAPADQGFWVVSSAGPGTQSLTWDAAKGSWTVVVMNATATPGVAVDFEAGARSSVLLPVGLGLLIGGLVIGALAALLIAWAVRKKPVPAEAAAEPGAGEAAPPPAPVREGAYPAALDNVGNRRLFEYRRALEPKGMYLASFGQPEHRWLGPVWFLARMAAVSPFVSQKMATFVSQPRRADLLALKELVEAGSLRPVVDRAYPLAQVPEAFRHLEQWHARGKVVITV